MEEDKPTSLHTWPFEYDPTPLQEGETHVKVRKGKGRKEQRDMRTQEQIQRDADMLKKESESLMKELEEMQQVDALRGYKRFQSGATSTLGHQYELIPGKGLACAADRFTYGLKRHPDGCYNNITNHLPLADREWLTERLSHCIQHCLNAIKKLNEDKISGRNYVSYNMASMYDDAGAIAFAGLVLGEAAYDSYHSAGQISTQQAEDPRTNQEPASDKPGHSRIR